VKRSREPDWTDERKILQEKTEGTGKGYPKSAAVDWICLKTGPGGGWPVTREPRPAMRIRRPNPTFNHEAHQETKPKAADFNLEAFVQAFVSFVPFVVKLSARQSKATGFPLVDDA
jgi:hypothetical protein